ncbi:MAG: glycosyltransferase [Erysipelotrichales bacterium]|nr:glycosyltransferase [Erysipelotrichales bacterium]
MNDVNNKISLVALNCINKNDNKIVKIIFHSNKKLENINIEYNNSKKEYNLTKLMDELYFLELILDKDVKKLTAACEYDYSETIDLKIKKPSILRPTSNKVDLVGIQLFALSGIKNAAFLIQGTVASKDFKVKILGDGEELEYISNPVDDDYSFSIKASLKKKTKLVEFILSINNQDFVVKTIKNSILNRINNRVKTIIKRIIGKIRVFCVVMVRGIKFLWREHHFLVPLYLWPKYFKRLLYRMKNVNDLFYNPFIQSDYNKWLMENKQEVEIKELSYNPLISVLIPVYNVKSKYLEECINSVLEQSYQNFEICLVDDASTLEETIETLKKYEKIDDRIKIKYRKENGHISASTNDALKMAKGEFIALLDNDDVLDKNALYENVLALNENKKLDFIYSDEDKLDLNGKYRDPHFKPDFSPDTLLSLNYICHFSVIRKSLVEKVGGFEVGLEGAQDHDLFLKISENTREIHHIPKILYHWRMSETSTAMNLDNKAYINDIGIKVIENALKRRGLKGIVKRDPVSNYFIVEYETTNNPLVSIIIPTKDYADTLATCLNSLFKKTIYKNYEVIVVNNNSVEQATFDLFESFKKKHKNFKVIDANFEFNYSKINNLAVKESKGDYILLLNNDTEVIDPNWLSIMLGYAMLPHAGAIGPKLLYPDTTVQHAGVILGLGGVASHAYLGSDRKDPGMYGRMRVPYDYGAVTAACLLVKKSKYLEVGGLEEELKVAYNDIDFNIKLLERGYYNICVPQTEMFHYESKSRGLDNTSEKYKRFLTESKYMNDKWGSRLTGDPFYNPNFASRAWFLLDRKGKEKNNNFINVV